MDYSSSDWHIERSARRRFFLPLSLPPVWACSFLRSAVVAARLSSDPATTMRTTFEDCKGQLGEHDLLFLLDCILGNMHAGWQAGRQRRKKKKWRSPKLAAQSFTLLRTISLSSFASPFTSHPHHTYTVQLISYPARGHCKKLQHHRNALLAFIGRKKHPLRPLVPTKEPWRPRASCRREGWLNLNRCSCVMFAHIMTRIQWRQYQFLYILIWSNY